MPFLDFGLLILLLALREEVTVLNSSAYQFFIDIFIEKKSVEGGSKSFPSAPTLNEKFSISNFLRLSKLLIKQSPAALLIALSPAIIGLPHSSVQGSEVLNYFRPAQIPTSSLISDADQHPMPDGVYLFGQSPEPQQLGSAYLVFEVNQNQVVGAFYMPQSSFDCFQGEFQNERLALNIVNSYEQTVYPYSLALDTDSAVALAAGEAIAPVGLEGYHRIDAISDNDQRILGVCQSDFQK
jgi:hypothetical protein